jgi:hypothetical protein
VQPGEKSREWIAMKIKNVASVLALVLCGALSSGYARATVITFDGSTPFPFSIGYYQNTQYQMVADGRLFSAAPIAIMGTEYVNHYFPGGDSSILAWNGSDYLIGYDSIKITGGPFNISSLDVAGWNDLDTIQSATVTGSYVGGGTISKTLQLNNNAATQVGNDFVHFSLDGFNNLSSFRITPLNSHGYDGPYVAIDNINISVFTEPLPPIAPIPEPETYAMLLAGLGLLGLTARRRRQRE